MNSLTFLDSECLLDVRKTYTGLLAIECSTGDDDKSYKEVPLSLTPDQQDKLQAWLASKEPELTLTDDENCTLSLLRRATGLEVKCLDRQTWMEKPAAIKI
jgi:hypothetical protein